MWIIFLLIFTSCSNKTYVDVLDRPKPTEIDSYKRIKPTDGYENKKKFQYYNSLQFKSKYKRN
jgi:hypothetical protein